MLTYIYTFYFYMHVVLGLFLVRLWYAVVIIIQPLFSIANSSFLLFVHVTILLFFFAMSNDVECSVYFYICIYICTLLLLHVM